MAAAVSDLLALYHWQEIAYSDTAFELLHEDSVSRLTDLVFLV